MLREIIRLDQFRLKKTVTVVVQLPAAVVAVDVLIANLRNNFV
jgi:hypothetical protein